MVVLNHHAVINTNIRRWQPTILILRIQTQRLETINPDLARRALGIADTGIIRTNSACREMEQTLLTILAPGNHTTSARITLEAPAALRARWLILLGRVLAQRIV
jgi:hypothetical protein